MPQFNGPAGWPAGTYVAYWFNISGNFNYLHRVYTGTSISALSVWASVGSTHCTWLAPGTEYYMQVDGWHFAADRSDPVVGTISYTVTPYPVASNDWSTRPTMLVPGVTQFPLTPMQHNGGAQTDVNFNEPVTPGGIGRTVWYR